MKKWRCSVCGYVHTGEEPPDKCPVCGADRSKFVELTDEESARPSGAKPTGPAGGKDPAASPSRWKCTVCGYIHTGDAPPEICPVCGAERSKFVELADGDAGTDAPSSQPSPVIQPPAASDGTHRDRYRQISALLTRLHGHPISVHIPNGVLPLCLLFMVLSIGFESKSLGAAAFWNLAFVAAFMPVVLFTGYNDWQQRFGGNMTPVFLTKIICGTIVLVSAPILAIWWTVDPELLETVSSARLWFGVVCLITVTAAVVAGYMGGKLVFPGNDP